MVICESDLAGESLCGLFFCSILGMAASTEIVALDGRLETIYIGTAAREKVWLMFGATIWFMSALIASMCARRRPAPRFLEM